MGSVGRAVVGMLMLEWAIGKRIRSAGGGVNH